MKTPANQLCPHCGGSDEQLGMVGPLAVVLESNYGGLATLFRGELDDYRCRLCGKTVGVRPTVLVGDSVEKKFLLCLGERAQGVPLGAIQELVIPVSAKDATLETCATLDELKGLCAKRVEIRMQQILQSLNPSKVELQAFMTEGWSKFPSSCLAAAALMLSMPLPGVAIELQEGTKPESLAGAISNLQVIVWLAFCGSWSSDKSEGRSLESELAVYVAPEAMLHTAADEFVRVTENTDEWTRPGVFCVEVVRASLLAWRGQPNPRPKKLADLFVESEVMRAVAGADAPDWLKALEISEERARSLFSYEVLFDACARSLAQNGPRFLHLLDAVAKRVGYPDLAAQLVNAYRPLPGQEKRISVAKLVEVIRAVRKDRPVVLLLGTVSKLIDLLDEKPSPEVMDRVTVGLKEILGDSTEVRAHLVTWLARELLARQHPAAALKRLGDHSQEWESDLTAHVRSHLWVERSNALRMVGRRKEAITVAEATLADLVAAGEPEPDDLRHNLGILYSENGQPERALEIFRGMLPNAKRDERLNLLYSIFATYASLGRAQEGLPYLEEAKQLARGPMKEKGAEITASLAATLSTSGERQRALSLLREFSLDALDDPTVLLPYASAWGNMLNEPALLSAEDRQRISDTVGRLNKAQKDTYKAGNLRLHLDLVRILAFLSDSLLKGRRNVFCELLDIGAREFEGAPDPWALTVLARDELAEGNRDKSIELLMELPTAVAARFAPKGDIGLRVSSLQNLKRVFAQIVGLLIRRTGAIEDVRLVAELQRDFFGRMLAASASNMGARPGGFVAPEATAISRLRSPVAVVEWVNSVDGVVGIVSRVDGNGKVTVTDLSPSPVDLDELGPRINQRLSAWHPGRKGDPFEAMEWKDFEKWLAAEVEAHLPDGGQLVIVEHSEVAGLPWHVAAAPRWRTSYVPSWSAILGSGKESPTHFEPALGVALVPRYGESPDVLAAMEKSARHIVDLAHRLNRTMHQAMREDCDRAALEKILNTCTVAKLLCHGFVDPAEQVVAWMLANNGTLPLANSVAADTPLGRQHRFGWRECQSLTSAPQVIFSAACSSGHAQVVGLGERLGLFSTLRRFGTRTLIAPRWDVDAEAVLPIVDDAMERYLETRCGVGEALHAACVNASKQHPRRLAWALSLEGHWL